MFFGSVQVEARSKTLCCLAAATVTSQAIVSRTEVVWSGLIVPSRVIIIEVIVSRPVLVRYVKRLSISLHREVWEARNPRNKESYLVPE